MEENYLEINKANWDERAEKHVGSAFYNNTSFLAGQSSLNEIELSLLGEIRGKHLLHLQCHFGQDSISLSRLGAKVTGLDFSPAAIEQARQLAAKAGTDTEFVCCDVYSARQHIARQFDIVFSSYGTIGWLPDLHQWASVISASLVPGGRFVFAEFHPVVWMFDDDFEKIAYAYFKAEPIVEEGSTTYTGDTLQKNFKTISWNHSLAEVLDALLKNGLQLQAFQEYDYSPYNCFNQVVEVAPKQFRIRHLEDKIPMVFALVATKPA